MKKYSWIVALLMALTFATIFIGCGADPIEIEDTDSADDFTQIDLGEFNTWGGGAAPGSPTQQGWATDGFNWTDGGKMTAKELGYSLEDFQAATYLVLELKSSLSAGVQLIWGGNDATDSLGGWNSSQIVTNTGGPDAAKGVSLSGNTLKIALPAALANYDKFISEDATALRLVVASYSPGPIVADLFSEAYLLISNIFTPVEGITLGSAAVSLVNTDFALSASITPEDATVQRVSWQIVSSKTTANAEWVKIPVLSNQFDPPKDVGDFVWSTNTITATTGGKVTVRATLAGGGEDKEDFVKEFEITIVAPVSVTPTNLTAASAVDVTAMTGGYKVELKSANLGVGDKWDGANSGGGFYGSFRVALETGKTLNDYSGIAFNIKGLGGDYNYKEAIKIHASTSAISGWINNGSDIEDDRIGVAGASAGNITNGADVTVYFGATSATLTALGNTPYIAIYYHVSGWDGTPPVATAYQITDIKLIPKL